MTSGDLALSPSIWQATISSENARTALAAIAILRAGGWNISEEHMCQGLGEDVVTIPACTGDGR